MKVQAFVKYVVEVEFDIDDNATEEEIQAMAEEEGNEQWSSNASVDDIECYY